MLGRFCFYAYIPNSLQDYILLLFMYDTFELPVAYKNETLMMPAQLVQTGYTHGFKVDVDGQEILFEPDEEGNYRALVKADESQQEIRTDLLESIARAIEAVTR